MPVNTAPQVPAGVGTEQHGKGKRKGVQIAKDEIKLSTDHACVENLKELTKNSCDKRIVIARLQDTNIQKSITFVYSNKQKESEIKNTLAPKK